MYLSIVSSLEKHTVVVVVVSDTGAKQCTAVGRGNSLILQSDSLYLWGAGSIVYALLRIFAKIAILTLRIQELLLAEISFAAASVHSSSLLCFHMVTPVYLSKLSLWMSTSKKPYLKQCKPSLSVRWCCSFEMTSFLRSFYFTEL